MRDEQVEGLPAKRNPAERGSELAGFPGGETPMRKRSLANTSKTCRERNSPQDQRPRALGPGLLFVRWGGPKCPLKASLA